MADFVFGPPAGASLCTETTTTSRKTLQFPGALSNAFAGDSGDELIPGGGLPFPGSDRDLPRPVTNRKRRRYNPRDFVLSGSTEQQQSGNLMIQECMDRVVTKIRTPLLSHWEYDDMDGYSSCEDRLRKKEARVVELNASLQSSDDSDEEEIVAPAAVSEPNDQSFDQWSRGLMQEVRAEKSIEQQRDELYRGMWKRWTECTDKVSAMNCYFCMYTPNSQSSNFNPDEMGIPQFAETLVQRGEPLSVVAKKVHVAMLEAHKKNPLIPPILTRHILCHLIKHTNDPSVSHSCMIKEVQTLADWLRKNMIVSMGDGAPEPDHQMVSSYLSALKTLQSLHGNASGAKRNRSTSTTTVASATAPLQS